MLQQKNRLRKQKEFDRVFEKNRRIKSTNFQLLIHYGKNLLEPKFGIIVSSKIGNAVVRNKTKRRLREIIKANMTKFPINAEYIIITYPQIAKIEFSLLKAEVEKALEAIKDLPNY
ncbi:ribonuclease P protein component [Candidatus Dojkabacteria bacterium]|nr:ribonuclease P protein component [Candidatus Dojkabacteria bacterium]